MAFCDPVVFKIENALKLMSKQTVLCVGDLMLDDFVYGAVVELSAALPQNTDASSSHNVLTDGPPLHRPHALGSMQWRRSSPR